MDCAKHLLVVYRAYVERTGMRIDFIERALSCSAETAPPSEDDWRNQPSIYVTLFSSGCRPFLEDLYRSAMRMMSGRHFSDCDDALKGLVFLQEVAATALWRYRCPIGSLLASFAREFDRLDMPAERERLHAVAQTLT